MTQAIAPRAVPVKLIELKPTQMTVGMGEVEAKRKRWGRMKGAKRKTYLASHMVPVVLGKGGFYLLDHHHECLALLLEGQTEVLVEVRASLEHLSEGEFWTFLDNANWCHPYDAEGKRCAIREIPEGLKGLKDDPWRSLAGEVRRAGGYAKADAPFSEFRWADFLRRRMAGKVAKRRSLAFALELAHSREAEHLPGWSGVHDG
jgi:hypothetical protein